MPSTTIQGNDWDHLTQKLKTRQILIEQFVSIMISDSLICWDQPRSPLLYGGAKDQI